MNPWTEAETRQEIIDSYIPSGWALRSRLPRRTAIKALRGALVAGVIALLGGCQAPAGVAVGGAILPDEAFFALLEYIEALPYVGVLPNGDPEPVFMLLNRMMEGGLLRANIDDPEIYLAIDPSSELLARLSELGIETCRVTEQGICREAQELYATMMLIVTDGATDTEALFRPTLFFVGIGTSGYSAIGVEYEVSRVDSEWSVQEMGPVFNEN